MFLGKKTNIVTNEIMINTLSSLLIEGETLQTPIYAICERRGRQKYNGFCFVGTTETALLYARLNIPATLIEWTTRISLEEIKEIKIKKSLFANYIIIKIAFNDGNFIHIRSSTKAFTGGFVNQEIHLLCFIERLSAMI